MIGSLGILFLTGLLFSWLAKKCRLPGLVGMLLAGVVCGPCGFNLLDESLLSISSDLRKIALIIILIRAGLTLNLKDLKKVGRPAVLLSFLPASFEILGYVVAAPFLFHLSIPEAALTGAVLAAVSPAVVVPRMVKLMEEGYGTEEGIPQMLMAGSVYHVSEYSERRQCKYYGFCEYSDFNRFWNSDRWPDWKSTPDSVWKKQQ